MKKEVLLSVDPREVRVALLDHGKVCDLSVERNLDRIVAGNIYKGKVKNILKNIESAFVDIGEESNGFIHISDILENTQRFQEIFDIDPLSENDSAKKKGENISDFLKVGQDVLVQVVKEPMGTKGARLTCNLSIPGRYLVLLPNSPHRGVSRKIQDHSARERLKKIISAFEMPADVGLICRTASSTVPTDVLVEEAHDLWKLWNSIYDRFLQGKNPTCLFKESDIILKAVITALDYGYDRLVVDDKLAFQSCQRMVKKQPGDAAAKLKIELYEEPTPLFERFGVDKEIEKALRHKVWLPSGGYLFFDKTEAMLTIDVNSGRTNTQATGDVEETILSLNMEAADEIARQLRLRNTGGLIICDFIDMRSRKNQKRLLDRLKEAMKDDSARCTILGMSEFGLVEMTRQRQRESLAETLFAPCPYCDGLGQIKNHDTVLIELERSLKSLSDVGERGALEVIVHPELYRYLEKSFIGDLLSKAEAMGFTLALNTSDNYHLNHFEVFSQTSGKKYV